MTSATNRDMTVASDERDPHGTTGFPSLRSQLRDLRPDLYADNMSNYAVVGAHLAVLSDLMIRSNQLEAERDHLLSIGNAFRERLDTALLH